MEAAERGPTVDAEPQDAEPQDAEPRVAVIGGSGFYELLDGPTEVLVETPFGAPSGLIAIGELGGRRTAFVARHGPNHELAAHRVPYRANIWALHRLGVTRIIGVCASGSLRDDLGPGDFVVCDQLVDRTVGRKSTYYEGPEVHHVSFADPYCPELRAVALEALRSGGIAARDGGVVVVIPGPRFSTRAESRWYRSAGFDLVNMTQLPEAVLARELGMCYACIALVTDRDAGTAGTTAVSAEEVYRVLAPMVGTLRSALPAAVAAIPPLPSCSCHLAAGPPAL